MLIQGSTALLSLVAVAQGLSIRHVELDNKLLRRQNNGATCLQANAIQKGSQSTGQETPAAGQVASATYVIVHFV